MSDRDILDPAFAAEWDALCKELQQRLDGFGFTIIAWDRSKQATRVGLCQGQPGEGFKAACNALLATPMDALIPEVVEAASAAESVTDWRDAQDLAGATALTGRTLMQIRGSRSSGTDAAIRQRAKAPTTSAARMVAAAGFALRAAVIDLSTRPTSNATGEA